MPPLAKLREIGFTAVPRWWQEKSVRKMLTWKGPAVLEDREAEGKGDKGVRELFRSMRIEDRGEVAGEEEQNATASRKEEQLVGNSAAIHAEDVNLIDLNDPSTSQPTSSDNQHPTSKPTPNAPSQVTSTSNIQEPPNPPTTPPSPPPSTAKPPLHPSKPTHTGLQKSKHCLPKKTPIASSSDTPEVRVRNVCRHGEMFGPGLPAAKNKQMMKTQKHQHQHQHQRGRAARNEGCQVGSC